MKPFLFLILLTATFSTNAQVPDYFADAPEWQQGRLCYMNNDQENWDFVYYLDGDTIVNSTTWHKVYKRGTYEVSGFCGSGGYSYNFLRLLIRQDSMKIFVYENSNSELLYDFDLSVGDTLPVTYFQMANNIVVDSIGTIMINGTVRRQYFLAGPPISLPEANIIEGIGSNHGLIEPIGDQLNCGYYFHCFSVNDIVEVGTDCNFEVSTQELFAETEITLSPNPVKNKMTISFPATASVESVKCYNQEGREFQLDAFQTASSTITTELNDDLQGIFIIELLFESGQIVRKKIVKL
jgi:hypothetical protein